MESETNLGLTDNHDAIIDITSSSSSSNESFSSTSHDQSLISLPRDRITSNDTSINGGSNSRNSLLSRRESGRIRNRSPLNSGLWISVELVLTLSQVIAAIVVLCFSKNEHPGTPLFLWVVGYGSGCFAVLPLLFWRYRNRNTNDSVSRGAVNIGLTNSRFKVVFEYYKMASDCFFAVWFVIGIVWISNGHSYAVDAPNLYRVSIVFLTISGIGYAMPFILCTTICCCFPCIISVLGYREDQTQSKGATSASISSLPTYKFKVKKPKTSSEVADGGIILHGTEEHILSGEDAVCCICLVNYANNDELKGLLCIHYFHKECIEKWLKINASCPLCKAEVGQTIVQALTEATANLRPGSLP